MLDVRRIRRAAPMLSLEERLKHLGYDQRWLTFGFLDPDVLHAQHEACLSSRDSYTEHFRFESFRRFLADRASLSDVQLEQYVELAVLDSDQFMAVSALANLLIWPGLSPLQLEQLASHAAFEPPSLRRLVVRRRLLASILAGRIDDAIVASCIASNDSAVQRAVIRANGITGRHLDLLSRSGCNRAVRNLATQCLLRRLNDSPN